MEKSFIYCVTVTTIHYIYKNEPREYSADKTKLDCDIDNRSFLFLSFDAAEKRKNDLVMQYHSNLGSRLFSICIDEYEEGADITVYHPIRAWYYDCNGQLVKELVRIGDTMVFVSEKGLPNEGDIVEIPLSSTSMGLGIITSVPNERTDYIGNLSPEPLKAMVEVPYDPRCYTILTGMEDFDLKEYESVDFMAYSGERGRADFMKEFLETYKRQYMS